MKQRYEKLCFSLSPTVSLFSAIPIFAASKSIYGTFSIFLIPLSWSNQFADGYFVTSDVSSVASVQHISTVSLPLLLR